MGGKFFDAIEKKIYCEKKIYRKNIGYLLVRSVKSTLL